MATLSNLRPHTRSAVAAAAGLLLAGMAQAQTTITITGRSDAAGSVSGFGGPLASLPVQATSISADTLRDAGIGSLAGITQLDARLSDAYNTTGYWSGLTMRGFEVSQRSNFRRDGLPINAETALPLANKERIEVLAGTSGIQAGTSAPAGLVNLVVKRPVARLREASLGWSERGTLVGAADLSQRFGSDGRWGARVNVEAAQLRPLVRHADGRRHLVALALDAQLTPDSKLEFELEHSHQSQPSVPAFSLLGDRVPDAKAIDPRTSLNNQPWSQPVVLDGRTASLRWQHRLAADWTLQVHGATQRLDNDDRVAFPYGCSNEAGTYYADRYCPDGSFDLYDFRSENERRRTDAIDVQLQGRVATGPVRHTLTAGALASRVKDRFQRQAYNYVGAGRIDGSALTPADPSLTDENTLRDERSRELYLRDALSFDDRWRAWAGLRHTWLERESVRTDGSRPTSYEQSFTTPWLALGYAPAEGTLLYASWGQGVESQVVPNRSKYRNAGQALPSLKSRQFEAGARLAAAGGEVSIAAFDIQRPAVNDFCDADGRCERRVDGEAHHRGLELAAAWRQGPWALRGSASWIQARRQGSADTALNGRKPTNVPDQSFKAQLSRELLPGLTMQADLVHEGRRAVLPDNSVTLGGWTRLDASMAWRLPSAPGWRLLVGVDNLADRRAWREAPYQFEHAYLMPLAPRTWRAQLTGAF